MKGHPAAAFLMTAGVLLYVLIMGCAHTVPTTAHVEPVGEQDLVCFVRGAPGQEVTVCGETEALCVTERTAAMDAARARGETEMVLSECRPAKVRAEVQE